MIVRTVAMVARSADRTTFDRSTRATIALNALRAIKFGMALQARQVGEILHIGRRWAAAFASREKKVEPDAS